MNEEELNLDNLETQSEEKIKIKNRFEKLSEKVILTAKEKEAEVEARKKAETERDSLSKERDFFRDFSKNITKYPNASEYQDKILEKVKGGYSIEDAMVAVLAKEGKLTQSSAPTAPITSQSNIQVEGGSAITGFEGTKEIRDMSKQEKYNALVEADKRGDLAALLRR